jgi:starch-binding outer membrane protein SusE/F
MKKNLAICSLIVSAILIAMACNKVKDLPYYSDGNKVTLEASKAAVIATAADSAANVITFSWSDPKYAADTSTYKYVLEIDSASRNFSKKVTKTVIGVRSRSLTGKELNDIVLNYGFSLGVAYNMDVRLISSYGNNNEQYTSNVVKVAVTPYKDSSVLTSTQTSVTVALATASQNSLTFNWSRSFNGYSGIVTYTLQYDSAGKNFVAPLDMVVGPSLQTRAMTQGEINTTALNSGIPGGNSGKVEYRIKAVTAQGAVAYSNVVFVTIQSYVPILRFYMPGSYQVAGGYGGSDWEPTTAPELIRDLRPGLFNNMYYIYIYLPANAEFKITEGRSWNTNYGGTGGALALNSPSNLKVTTAGVYRISINRTTLQYDIREGRMGFVGGGTGAGWTPPNVFPTYAMGAPATNLFVGLTNLTTADAWKLIDNDAWNSGSNLVNETRSYGSNGASGSTMEVNGPNFATVSTNGRYRVIWDGRDPNNIKYEMSPGTEMRVVGDGINQAGVGDWDPPSSPQMTYMGNGVWTISITLKADKDIKFLAGNAWGALDYEDNSGQSQALGTPRPIKWEGGNNFKTPSVAGTYTVTLNENTQRVTIN